MFSRARRRERGGAEKLGTTHLEALLAGLDGGNVARNTTADNDQVLLLSLGSIRTPPSWQNDGKGGFGEGRADRGARY